MFHISELELENSLQQYSLCWGSIIKSIRFVFMMRNYSSIWNRYYNNWGSLLSGNITKVFVVAGSSLYADSYCWFIGSFLC